MKQQHKFSLGYYMFVFFSIVLLESIFFSGAAVKEIPYSRFWNMLIADITSFRMPSSGSSRVWKKRTS